MEELTDGFLQEDWAQQQQTQQTLHHQQRDRITARLQAGLWCGPARLIHLIALSTASTWIRERQKQEREGKITDCRLSNPLWTEVEKSWRMSASWRDSADSRCNFLCSRCFQPGGVRRYFVSDEFRREKKAFGQRVFLQRAEEERRWEARKLQKPWGFSAFALSSELIKLLTDRRRKSDR